MKRILFAAIIALMILPVFNSCIGGGGAEQVGSEAKLFGRWQNDQDTTYYRVYYSTKVTDEEYRQETGLEKTEEFYWGKEWTGSEGVFESDLVEHGNGWYMWRKISKDLLELYTMDNHGSVIDRTYTLTILNDSVLSYKNEAGKKFTFNKIASR